MRWSFVVAACLAASSPSACTAAAAEDTSETSLPISTEPSEPTATPGSFCAPGLAQLLPKSALVTEEDFDDAEILPIDYEDADFLKFLGDLTEADADTPPAREVIGALKGRKGEDTRRNVQCVVCFGCLDAESLATPDCGHYFHDRCLVMVRSGRCPLCRIPAQAAAGNFGRKTVVKKMLGLFEEKKWTPRPRPREPDPARRPLDDVPEAVEYLKGRARYHIRAFRGALYEMTKGIRAAAGVNLKHLIGGLLNFSMRRVGWNNVVEAVDILVYGPFGDVEERHDTFLRLHSKLHELLTLAGASPRFIDAEIPSVPNPENLASSLHYALNEFDRLNYSFGEALRPLYDRSPLMLSGTSLRMIEVTSSSYEFLAAQMSPVSRREDLGAGTQNFLLHRRLLDRMRECLRRQNVAYFTNRYLQPDIYGEAGAIRRSELLYRIEYW